MSNFIPNSTQVPNAVFDELMPEMSDAALRCYLVISRQTTGWQKTKDKISISQFVKKTGKSKPTVIKGCEELENMGLIKKVSSNSKTEIPEYSLVFGNYAGTPNACQYTLQELVKIFNITCQDSLQTLVKIFDTHKTTITKTTITKEYARFSDFELVLVKIELLGTSIPQAHKISENRKKIIKDCLRKFGLDSVFQMLDKAAKSPLTDKAWFSFDFMWKDTAQSQSFLSIIEGKYDNEFAHNGKAPALNGNAFGDNL